MPRRLLPFLVLLALARPAAAVSLPVAERTLPNGLLVLVHEDHSAPVVSSYVFFRSGSRNEHDGTTGIAHLFEHMMFNGAKKYGPGIFDDLIEGNGGSTNGYTTRDFTTYLNNFPREALPLILDLESDRMANLAITPKNLAQERGIVMEERRLRIDDDVTGAMNENLYLHAYVRAPYRWNTVGFMADLKRITLEDCQHYFTHNYAPNNAVLVLAGDLDPEPTFALVQRYFGRIPRRPPPGPVDAEEPAQRGERRIALRMQAELPAVYMGYHAVRATDPDRAALDVAAQLLADGESSRLYRDLVRGREVATGAYADLDWGIDPELFSVYAQARPGKTADDVIARVDVVVAALAKTAPAGDELAKAKRQLLAEYVKGLKTVSGKANKLGFFQVVFGDYHAMFGLEAGWDAVTAEDVRRVAATYLVPEQRSIVILQPTAADGAVR